MKRTVVVFARLPVRGRVKTRLASGIGDAAALDFHRSTLGRTCRVAARGPWRLELCVTPDWATRRRRIWKLPAGARLAPQGSGGLGVRMGRAIRRNRGPVLLVGCDIPEMTISHLHTAFALLGTHDAVFGPAADGGFWLVGFRSGAVVGRSFDGARWSSPYALADCLSNLQSRRVAIGPVLNDIDDLTDFASWNRRKQRNHSGRIREPIT